MTRLRRARPEVGPGDPVALAVWAALSEGRDWLAQNAPRAAAGEVEGVHHLRTTTRRLRSTIHLFDGLIEPARSEALADDLAWLAGVLGQVRDLDVLSDRLAGAAEGLDRGEAEALAPLFDDLRDRRRAGALGLGAVLQGSRYAGLTARLDDAIEALAPPLRDAAPEALAPCREALPPRVVSAWRALKRAGRALDEDSPEEAFHAVRKKAKRARYAAEAVAPALDRGPGRVARRFGARARAVQETLGDHQDAAIAAAALRAAAAEHPDLGPLNLAVGRLIERESVAAADARAGFFRVWKALDRKKPLKGLKG